MACGYGEIPALSRIALNPGNVGPGPPCGAWALSSSLAGGLGASGAARGPLPVREGASGDDAVIQAPPCPPGDFPAPPGGDSTAVGCPTAFIALFDFVIWTMRIYSGWLPRTGFRGDEA